MNCISHDRPHAHERRADRGADDRRLGDRRVDDPLLAELVVQPFGDLERAAVGADVLADDEDALVALHLLGERLADRFEIGDDRHQVSPSCAGAAWTANGDLTSSTLGRRSRRRRTRRARRWRDPASARSTARSASCGGEALCSSCRCRRARSRSRRSRSSRRRLKRSIGSFAAQSSSIVLRHVPRVVVLGVPLHAHRVDADQRAPSPRARAIDQPLRDVVDRQHVVAVDHLVRDAVGGGALVDPVMAICFEIGVE